MHIFPVSFKKGWCLFSLEASVCMDLLSCNFDEWKKQLWKSLPSFKYQEVAYRKLFFWLKNSMPKSTPYKLKIGGLLMFSKICYPHARENAPYSSRGVCSKVMIFPVFGYPNTLAHLFFTRVSRGIHVTQM